MMLSLSRNIIQLRSLSRLSYVTPSSRHLPQTPGTIQLGTSQYSGLAARARLPPDAVRNVINLADQSLADHRAQAATLAYLNEHGEYATVLARYHAHRAQFARSPEITAQYMHASTALDASQNESADRGYNARFDDYAYGSNQQRYQQQQRQYQRGYGAGGASEGSYYSRGPEHEHRPAAGVTPAIAGAGTEEAKKWKNFRRVVFWLIAGTGVYYLYKNVSVSITNERSPGSSGLPGFSTARMMGSAHSLSRSTGVTLDDVRGCDEVKDEVVALISFLKDPDRYKSMGARLPKGILFAGPPGTGKTLLAKAIAGEAGVPFYYSTGASFDEMFVGVGVRRVKDMFDDAKRNAPCIVFIDEIDTIGASRKISLGPGRSGDTLNQLLTEIDGFQENSGVIVIGATNLPQALDAALIRPGRFDQIVTMPIPDLIGRKQILDLYLQRIKAAEDVSSDTIARATIGWTGAQLESLVNHAAIKAATLNLAKVDLHTIDEVRDDITMGLQRTNKGKQLEDIRRTAVHEGGHALVGMLTPGALPVHKVTILQRGSALGLTMSLPENDMYHQTTKELLASIAVAVAGRAAEDIIYGPDNVGTGASSDLEHATNVARRMVSEFGMSEKLGLVYISQDREKPLPPNKEIDDEIRKIVQEQYEYARNLLLKHSKELNRIADGLLEHETLTGKELRLIADGKPINTLRKEY